VAGQVRVSYPDYLAIELMNEYEVALDETRSSA
jgi:hypothetical protein